MLEPLSHLEGLLMTRAAATRLPPLGAACTNLMRMAEEAHGGAGEGVSKGVVDLCQYQLNGG